MSDLDTPVVVKDGQRELVEIVREGDGSARLRLGGLTSPGQLDIVDGTNPPNVRISMDAKDASLTIGGGGEHGVITLRDDAGNVMITLDADGPLLQIGGFTLDGHLLVLRDDADREMLVIDANTGDITLGANGGANAEIVLKNSSGNEQITLDADNRRLTLRDDDGDLGIRADAAGGGDLEIMNSGGSTTVAMSGPGNQIRISADDGDDSIVLEGANGGRLEIMNTGGNATIAMSGPGNSITLRDDNQNDTIRIDGVAGDIVLLNADGAEEFEVEPGTDAQPGTVMVIGEASRLGVSGRAYDRRVAGIVAGAGSYKPGIVLGRRPDAENALPIALFGRVFCKVDASSSPIAVGDLLTSSPTPGHAMKVEDPARAFGAVIGKALGPLESGRGLVPTLVALQ